jgi:hypothetical protein
VFCAYTLAEKNFIRADVSDLRSNHFGMTESVGLASFTMIQSFESMAHVLYLFIFIFHLEFVVEQRKLKIFLISILPSSFCPFSLHVIFILAWSCGCISRLISFRSVGLDRQDSLDHRSTFWLRGENGILLDLKSVFGFFFLQLSYRSHFLIIEFCLFQFNRFVFSFLTCVGVQIPTKIRHYRHFLRQAHGLGAQFALWCALRLGTCMYLG